MTPIARLLPALLLALLPGGAAAQFHDDFRGPGPQGWTWFTGDGKATIDFRVEGGRGVMHIDARADRDNIWWAMIKRDVARSLDVARLAQPGHELRVRARVRVPQAPRRVHLQANTQRTTNYHLNLREFDLPDTLWHVISMTSHGLDARPGDQVNIQLALTDAGLARYTVEVSDMWADVVRADTAPPDLGEPLVYQPPPAHAHPAAYGQALPAAQAAVVDALYPEVNFSGWHLGGGTDSVPVLGVSDRRYALLRFDVARLAGRRAAGHGVLELTTRALQQGPVDVDEWGQLRVFEVFGGDPAWQGGSVTLDRLLAGRPFDEVVNPQVLIDARVAPAPGGKTRITIPRAVLQRLLDGRTRGLLLRGLGPVDAAFDAAGPGAPRLYFDLEAERATPAR